MAYNYDFPEDRKRIEEFLRETETLLTNISTGKISLKDGPVLSEKAQHLAAEAIKEYLHGAPSLRFSDAAHIPTAETLAKGGLRGWQLKFKLSLIDELKEKFNRSLIRRSLLKLIDATDNLLGSLVALAGVDHALKELKDTLRGWIDEAGEY